MKAATGFFMVRAYSAASSSIDPPISPTSATASVLAVLVEGDQRIPGGGADDGSPPMPMKAEMPSPACTRLRHSSVPSEPGARDDAHAARLEHARVESRHEADEASRRP